MKKIGILTFQNADNYGALLQAYALKMTLHNQGHTVHILNYFCPKLEREYKIVRWPCLNLKDIIRQLIHLVMSPCKLYIRSRFDGFRKRYLTDTCFLYPDLISNQTKNYDLFISGSDQVFNPRITDFDDNFFLSFCSDKTKNHSYAASFGMQMENLTEKERRFLSKNLMNFSHISVREKQGTQIVKALTAQEAQTHLDPTLLITKNQWQSIALFPKKRRNYVLLYLMHKDNKLIEFAKRLAKLKGLKLLYISQVLDVKKRIPATHITPTVQQWLGLFLNASYVVTNSFHGLAFSINFNKNFFLGKLPASWPVNSRLDNLLDITGLQPRLYTHFTDNYDQPIDWETVNQKLAKERQKAFIYLKEITK